MVSLFIFGILERKKTSILNVIQGVYQNRDQVIDDHDAFQFSTKHRTRSQRYRVRRILNLIKTRIITFIKEELLKQ